MCIRDREQTVTLKNEVADAPITRGQEMGTLTISYKDVYKRQRRGWRDSATGR